MHFFPYVDRIYIDKRGAFSAERVFLRVSGRSSAAGALLSPSYVLPDEAGRTGIARKAMARIGETDGHLFESRRQKIYDVPKQSGICP